MASIPSIDVTITGYDPIAIDVSTPQGADGLVLQLDRPTLSIPSLSDGSSPVLTQAVITATVLRGPNNDTSNWTFAATPSGCTGSFASPTYTVSGMANDTATVTFTATRTGFATLTAVCTLAKVKQPDIATVVHAAGASTADDADEFGFWDSAVTALRKITWANIKSTLATAFKHGGSNEISTATAAANAIPKAGAGSTLAKEWLPAATTSAQGAVTLAADGETTAGMVVQANDSRLPTAAGKTAANDVGAATGATTALKLANLTTYATETQQGVVELATQAEADVGIDATKVLTPATFAGALEAGQIITTTLAVDGGFAATNFGSTEAISGGTANG